MTRPPLDAQGRTPQQALAYENEQRRLRNIEKLHKSLIGRDDNRGVGDFDRSKAK